MKNVIFILLFFSMISCSVTNETQNTMKAVQYRLARPTNQLDKVVAFYTQGLGLRVIGSFEAHDGYDGVMLGLPGETYHLEFTQHEDKTPLPPPTKENLLILYYDKPQEYLEAITKLKRFGAKEVAPENPYWINKSVTFEDPDGWRIVLFDGVFKSK